MKVVVASDHAGFELKEALLPFFKELGCDVEDMGAFTYANGDDYPDFIAKAAEMVSKDPDGVRGIIIGGSGQGEAIVANRFKYVRAAVYYGCNKDILRLSREHNNANILSLGARFLEADEAKEAVHMWLNTRFSGDDRHVRRINKIEEYGR